MKLFDNEAYVYDIEYVDGKFQVTKYYTKIESEQVNGTAKSLRKFHYIETTFPESLQAEITSLKSQGYKHIGNFFPNDLVNYVICPNYLLSLKLWLMEKNCVLLEKLYNVVSINGEEKIMTYIVYVDLKTGIVYQMNMGILGANVSDNYSVLQANAYIPTEQSKFYNDLEAFKTTAPLTLNRKKGN